MTLESDYLVDRRRMRRRLAVWRVLAIVALLGVVGALTLLAVPVDVLGQSKRADHIARLTISGVITDDRKLLKLVDTIRKTDRAKAVIVSVASPGGTASGGEALYMALRDLNAAKPTVTHISALATSAGYMVALASDHIVARSNAITGSIGVLFQYADASELLDTVGVQFDAIKSSTLKAEPDFYSPPPEEAKAMIAELVDDSYNWFVDLVDERRELDRSAAIAVSDGSIFTGRQALEQKLVDAVGGEDAAVVWLSETHGIDKNLPIVDWRVDEDSTVGLGSRAVVATGRIFGLDLSPLVSTAERVSLDGLVSVWHGPSDLHTGERYGAVGEK